jgi:TolB-like protein/Tfp pilus assembly protein PilF
MPDQLSNDDTVMNLVDLALSRPPEERESFLRSACGGDAELLQQTWTYVQWEQRMNGFLLDPIYRALDQERPFAPGELLEGRFRILREVAEGGMGIVYEAQDEKLDRRIAIKCAKQGYGGRLPPEVRTARDISHHNVCKIFEIHTALTQHREIDFITMEFLEGETLAARLRRGCLPDEEGRTIARQLCAGLAEAHRYQVIHGDLKSNNIILTTGPDGALRAVITDFGLAQGLGAPQRIAEAGGHGGTPDYMAPELLHGGKASVATDIYALGVILHELTFGRRPDAPEVSEALVSRQERAGQKTPGRPRLYGILERCLDPDPARRFRNVDEIAQALAPPRSRRWFATAAAAAVLTAGAGAGAIVYLSERSGASIPSIAVIPFVNDGGTAESEYLSDGISEGLINALVQLPDLKVIARSSSFKFKGKGIDVPKAARTLGVKALVTGRVAAMGNRLRISAELVSGADGTQIWGAQYSPAVSDLPAVQAQISSQIAVHIRSGLTQAERAKLEKHTKAHPEAYELLLRARYQIRLYTPESRQRAVSYYQQALAIDPAYALAHAELASAYRLLSGSAILSAKDMMPMALASAMRALAADPDLAEAHTALAAINKDQWDWAAAEREYRRAIELSPNLVSAHDGFAIHLSVLGKYAEAAAEIQRARQLDPIGLPTAIAAAAVAYNGRQYGRALDELKRAANLDPAAPAPWTWIGIVNGSTGHFAEAIAAYEKAIGFGDNTAATQCYYSYSLARSGRRNDALEILGRLRRSNGFVPLSPLGIVYAGLNQKDRAFQSLEAAYAARDPLLQYLKAESHFDSLNDDPRFHDLARRIGLP